MIKRILSFFLLMFAFAANAQEAVAPEMADAMRDNGKIYVVISVIGLIFLAIIIFLLYIERKVKKLEDKTKDLKQN